MENGKKKFRFLLVQAFRLPESSAYQLRPFRGGKEERLMNYRDIEPLLEDVEWDLHPGAPAPHGDWPVELGEEFLLVGASRLPIVREACESGKYNAIVLLGGGDPGFPEAREIARRYRIPVTANAHAQMHVAALLGNKFSIVDISEAHNMHMYNLVMRYRFAERCASIRNVNFPMPRPAFPEARPLHQEHARALAGENSDMVEAAVAEGVAAIEEDGAEVIILGCSATFWLQPLLQQRLDELGWEVPVLEGYRCAIELAKLMVNLGIDASGLAFPSDHPKKWRRKKVF
jgi:Asp/Glu/hydantoin racemase